MLYGITLTIATLALIVVLVIVFRHWGEIRLLDPDSIKEEREKQKRNELVLQRFERMRSEKIAPFKAMSQRAVFLLKTAYHEVYLRLVQLERFYTQAKTPFASINPSVKDRIKTLLDDARVLARDTKYADAERRYLEALTVDKRCFDAYRGLGGIYLKQKMYAQAGETFEFLLHAKKADDAVFAGLAEIAEADNDLARAEDFHRRAVEFRPRLPHRHAEMAEFYLSLEQPNKAKPFAKRAHELDAKSAKYLELFMETVILLGDRSEASRLYDKFRLLSDDRGKVQSLKDKIDAIHTPL